MKRFIKKIIPKPAKALYRRLFPTPKQFGWIGNYSSWAKAKSQSTGYDSTAILEKVKEAVLKVKTGEAVYERDSVLFDKIEYSQPVVDALQMIGKRNQNSLRVLDFGGSLGSSYFQNRGFLKELSGLKWSVVEQKHFVECGKEFIEDDQLKFFYSIEEVLKAGKPDVLFASSVIQYLEKPYELISNFLKYNFEFILIDRTAFIEARNERISLQVVPETIYKASYPAWFLNEKKFIKAFESKYDLIERFDSYTDPTEKIDGKWTYRKGFLFKYRDS